MFLSFVVLMRGDRGLCDNRGVPDFRIRLSASNLLPIFLSLSSLPDFTPETRCLQTHSDISHFMNHFLYRQVMFSFSFSIRSQIRKLS
jgi:hypothetical protein